MTPKEIFKECKNAITQDGSCGVILTIRKGSMPKGFPRGELLNEMQRHNFIERTYNFRPEKLLIWLDKNFPEVV